VIEIDDEDPLRRYTPEEQRILTDQLLAITTALHAGELRHRSLNLSLLRDLHAGLFQGIRGHAGRIRDRGYGTERLTFGPHRSSHRDKVREELEALFRQADARMSALNPGDEAFELEAVRLAVWTHAEIIRVHPFEDGNGRTSRLCAGHQLVRLGLRPVAMEAVKQEYTEALNRYYERGDLEPLVDLYVSLYPI
jgi:fido (protein-threonine AMPylation protein)